MTLRPYQTEGHSQIFTNWQTDDVLMFVLATGGGKTVTFTEAARSIIAMGKRALIVAHRKELIRQTWDTLFANGMIAGIIMADYPETFERSIQVCSIQTVSRREILPPADFIIIDEGHHAQRDNGYGALVMRYPESKVLLVTATPYRLSGEGFEYIHQYKKTKLLINRTLRELQEDGWLVPLRYFASSIPELEKIKLKKGDYEEEASKKIMSLAPIVESYLEHCEGMSGVCFAINVAHSMEIVKQYQDAGIPAEHLDANTPKARRDLIISQFKAGKILVIVNVGIITEGFDFPNLEFVQLARPTKSLSMFLQMVGRVTRPLKGLVDGVNERHERLNRIKQSEKPFGIVLDNAGCWIDHNMPDYDHDWEAYFRGAKKLKEKVDETIEMLVFIAEDEKGNMFKTHNAKEIEGLRLVEIKNELKTRVINLTSIKEFDKRYHTLKRLPKVNKPGYEAMRQYMDWCARRGYLMVPEIWKYLHKTLVIDIHNKLHSLEILRARELEIYPDEAYHKEVTRIKNLGVSEHWFNDTRDKYMAKNFGLIQKALQKTA